MEIVDPHSPNCIQNCRRKASQCAPSNVNPPPTSRTDISRLTVDNSYALWNVNSHPPPPQDWRFKLSSLFDHALATLNSLIVWWCRHSSCATRVKTFFIGGSRGACPVHAPLRVQILLFQHTKFSKRNRLGSQHPPCEVVDPPLFLNNNHYTIISLCFSRFILLSSI